MILFGSAYPKNNPTIIELEWYCKGAPYQVKSYHVWIHPVDKLKVCKLQIAAMQYFQCKVTNRINSILF